MAQGIGKWLTGEDESTAGGGGEGDGGGGNGGRERGLGFGEAGREEEASGRRGASPAHGHDG
jgi:hypothetical protein